jgi:hypothetical protein
MDEIRNVGLATVTSNTSVRAIVSRPVLQCGLLASFELVYACSLYIPRCRTLWCMRAVLQSVVPMYL